jgi:hypothetical protein
MKTVADTHPAGAMRYAAAGWLAILQAIILLPEIGLAVYLDFLSHANPVLKGIMAVLHLINLPLGVFVLLTLRRFLNERHDFHRVDGIILALVGCNMASLVIGLLGLSVSFEIVMAAAALAVLLVYSVINLVFAARILTLKDDLFGLLRPFAYLTIAASVLALTVILSPLGLLASMGAIILTGMILLRAREEMEIL